MSKRWGNNNNGQGNNSAYYGQQVYTGNQPTQYNNGRNPAATSYNNRNMQGRQPTPPGMSTATPPERLNEEDWGVLKKRFSPAAFKELKDLDNNPKAPDQTGGIPNLDHTFKKLKALVDPVEARSEEAARQFTDFLVNATGLDPRRAERVAYMVQHNNNYLDALPNGLLAHWREILENLEHKSTPPAQTEIDPRLFELGTAIGGSDINISRDDCNDIINSLQDKIGRKTPPDKELKKIIIEKLISTEMSADKIDEIINDWQHALELSPSEKKRNPKKPEGEKSDKKRASYKRGGWIPTLPTHKEQESDTEETPGTRPGIADAQPTPPDTLEIREDLKKHLEKESWINFVTSFVSMRGIIDKYLAPATPAQFVTDKVRVITPPPRTTPSPETPNSGGPGKTR